MNGVIELGLAQFSIIYILLLVIIAIMRRCKINQTTLLLVASIRMTLQLVIAGFILTYIFKNPHPAFTTLYLMAMIAFTIHRVLSKNPKMNRKFKYTVAAAIAATGLFIVSFVVVVIVRTNIFNPQYLIPLSGMVFGNIMTGLNLGLKTFNENLETQRLRIETLLNIGAAPDRVLIPFMNHALETALLPTMNTMVGMGIVSLPGMMTGQILSGTMPMTAILYQITMMIAICTAVCLSVFISLYLGYKTLYNSRNQIFTSGEHAPNRP